MPPQIALFLSLGFSSVLVWRELKQHPEVSKAVWIPCFWLLILGSRSVSQWLNLSPPVERRRPDGRKSSGSHGFYASDGRRPRGSEVATSCLDEGRCRPPVADSFLRLLCAERCVVGLSWRGVEAVVQEPGRPADGARSAQRDQPGCGNHVSPEALRVHPGTPVDRFHQVPSRTWGGRTISGVGPSSIPA